MIASYRGVMGDISITIATIALLVLLVYFIMMFKGLKK